ncbi:hypothetical protein C8R45DRAFT_250715 [Mycena sanguinolenta]|nr:hypothetical protein C8R45DRAFT_250715 [Mycena sanguinolenta]
MFTRGKSVLAYASLFLALAAQTSAHAMPSIALGVSGAPTRSDVQRPSTAKPCGTIDPATTLDTSTAIPVAADGSVTMNVQNFNAGADGSTSVSVQIDQTGTGNSFVPGTVTTNGNAAPKAVETDKVVFTLPAGTTCTGGTAGNLCLVSVKTTAGFGACTVVSQGAPSLRPPRLPLRPALGRARRLARKAPRLRLRRPKLLRLLRLLSPRSPATRRLEPARHGPSAASFSQTSTKLVQLVVGFNSETCIYELRCTFCGGAIAGAKYERF